MGSSASQVKAPPKSASNQQTIKTSTGNHPMNNGNLDNPPQSEREVIADNKMNPEETKQATDSGPVTGQADPTKEIKGDNENEVNNETEKDSEVKKKKEPFTPRELEDFRQAKFEELKKTAAEVLALKSIQNANGEFDIVMRNATIRISNSYSALTRANRDEIHRYRQDYGKLFVECGMVEVYVNLITTAYKQGWFDDDDKIIDGIMSPLKRGLNTLLNYSDASDCIANGLADKPSYLEFTKQVLEDYKDRHLEIVEPALQASESTVLNKVLLILYNISIRESNISQLRSVGFIQVLPPYLNSTTDINALSTLAALAGIINEQECDIINANKKTVEFLLKVLSKALEDARRRYRGWSAQECGLAIRTLARNDNNKKLLVDLGALELLVQLGQTGNVDEQCESAGAIWALCFDEDIQTRVTTTDIGVVDLLVELKKTDVTKIKHACNGALWTLRGALNKSPIQKYKQIGETLASQNDKRQKIEEQTIAATGGHIMLSYQWANQEIIKVIRDRLRECGYKIWMDIEQMGGSTLQAMADAVEGADIFLLCYSNKYKNSPACRAEAEYAFQLRKKIIPLKMEQGYNADGWLGFILGSKLYFEFSGKYPFERKMLDLKHEIKKAAADTVDTTKKVEPLKPVVSSGGNSTSQAVVQPTVTTVAKQPSSMTTVSKIRNWNTEETKRWIEDNGLQKCTLSKMSGAEIAFLVKMQNEAPEFFYRYLQDTLKARDVTTMAKIVWALNDLQS